MEALDVCLSPSSSPKCFTKVCRRGLRIKCMAKQKQGAPYQDSRSFAKLGCKLSGGLLAGILLCSNPCFADPIETVPASSVTEYAKPLEKQEIKKGEIWLVFVVGAATLFGGTLLLERNEKWFPAISKANKAMKMTDKMQAVQENEEPTPPTSSPGPSFPAEDVQSIAAVEEGLAEARMRFDDQQASTQPSTTIPQILSSVEDKVDESSRGVVDTSIVDKAELDRGNENFPSKTSSVGASEKPSSKPDSSP